jgi:hypothetical protein
MKFKVKLALQFVSILFVALLLNHSLLYAKEYPPHVAELPNTNSKMAGSMVYVYESQIPEYYKFINGRYGFEIDFPQSFNVALLPGNSDGGRFGLPDGSAELSASGGHNNARYTLNDYFTFTLQRIKGEIGYTAKGDDWFVVTWKEKGKIFYYKVFVSDDYYNSFTLSYPEAQKGEYDEIVSNIEKTFIPGWKTGYKIRG